MSEIDFKPQRSSAGLGFLYIQYTHHRDSGNSPVQIANIQTQYADINILMDFRQNKDTHLI